MLLIWNLCLSDEYIKSTNITNVRVDRHIKSDLKTKEKSIIDEFASIYNNTVIKADEFGTIVNATNRNQTDVELGGFVSDYINSTDEPCVGNPEFCNMSREEYIEMLNDYIYPQPYEWVLIVTHAIVFVIGLIGNALVCVAVYRNHSMRTVTNYFIVNLAVADFMVILICLPPTVLWDVTKTWFFGTAMCRIVLYFQVSLVTENRLPAGPDLETQGP